MKTQNYILISLVGFMLLVAPMIRAEDKDTISDKEAEEIIANMDYLENMDVLDEDLSLLENLEQIGDEEHEN